MKEDEIGRHEVGIRDATIAYKSLVGKYE